MLGKQIGKLRASAQRIATCSHLIPHVKRSLYIIERKGIIFINNSLVYIFRRKVKIVFVNVIQIICIKCIYKI